jgi:Leucine-rich repeat (LRR) protein
MSLPQAIREIIEANNPATRLLYAVSWHPYLEAKDMRELAECIKTSKNQYLTSFVLNDNQISDEGCKELQAIQTIRHLEVADNDIGNEGAIALSRLPQLQELVISCNSITDEGFLELVQKKELTYLNITYNNISEKAIEQMLQMQDSCITHLDLAGNEKISQKTLERVAAWLHSNKNRLEGKQEDPAVKLPPAQSTLFSPQTKYDAAVEQLRELPTDRQLFFILRLVNTWPESDRETLRQRLGVSLKNVVRSETMIKTPQ